VIKFNKEYGLHPLKPVALFEYLIKHTNEGETVLDNCGFGVTGEACINTNRNFIIIELDPEYFKIAEKRINENL
jgi:site-specific DNA-methyltransferase (adenine-specific)